MNRTAQIANAVAADLERNGLRFSLAALDIAAAFAVTITPDAHRPHIVKAVSVEVMERTGLDVSEALYVAERTVEHSHPDFSALSSQLAAAIGL